MQTRGEVPQNVTGIIWTYLQEFMGAGCPMAHGDLRRLYLGGKGGRVGGGAGLWLLPLHPGGPGGGEGSGGVCWRRRLGCILLMTF